MVRQATSEFLNELPEQYELEISADNTGRLILLTGDDSLLHRMLSNLINNSIVHNREGCKITLHVELDVDTCIFKVVDTGCGISDSRLDLLNNGTSISSTQEEIISIDHGLGLKIVQQIVKAHHGKIHFRKNSPHGLTAKISLPLI